MGRKLWALRRIHHTVRQLAGTGIAKYRSRPIATADVGRKRLPPDAHPLAVMWVAFSRLSAAVQLLDSEYVRSTYPLQSIAKLAAAEATGVAWEVNDKRFTFTLKGLSANAKFKEGDYALLVPETLRDSGDSARCDVVIDAMQWDATLGGYRAEAVANPRSGGHLLRRAARPADAVVSLPQRERQLDAPAPEPPQAPQLDLVAGPPPRGAVARGHRDRARRAEVAQLPRPGGVPLRADAPATSAG